MYAIGIIKVNLWLRQGKTIYMGILLFKEIEQNSLLWNALDCIVSSLLYSYVFNVSCQETAVCIIKYII